MASASRRAEVERVVDEEAAPRSSRRSPVAEERLASARAADDSTVIRSSRRAPAAAEDGAVGVVASESVGRRARRRSAGPDGIEARQKLSERLESCGYKPVKKGWIFARDEEGREAPAYVIATLFGELVFIYLDTNIPRMSAIDDDLRVQRHVRGVITPDIDDILKGVDVTNCGAACWSGSGLCAVDRNPTNLDLERHEFTVTSKPVEETTSLYDPALLYPVVRLSQIEKNNALVMKTVHIQTAKFRITALAAMEVRKLAFLVAAQHLATASKKMAAPGGAGAFSVAHANIERFLAQAEQQKSVLCFPPTPDMEKSFNKVMTFSSLCHRSFESLVMKSAHLVNLTKEINMIISDLDKMLEEMQKECQ